METLPREPKKQAPAVPATEQNFKEMYSRFKIELLMANGSALHHYGSETNATVADMLAGITNKVLLNAKQGFEDCRAFEQRYRNSYSVAVLYRRNRRNMQWQPVCTYGPQGEVLQETPIQFERHITEVSCRMESDCLVFHNIQVLAAA